MQTLPIPRRAFLQTSVLGAGALLMPSRLRASVAQGFTHGVASGEPRHDAVLLWTRYRANGDTRLRVEVAEDERFGRIAARGEAVALAGSDHVARVIASGLDPGRRYHYRFLAPDGQSSPVGRTRTLPLGRPERFRIAVFSCSNATSGWFNAYAHAAAREDIDLVVHLGDYIYESPIDRSDAVLGLAAARGVLPAHETVALADYRARYASYREDPDLAALHAAFPMIAVPDDHESANNSWREGASGHGPHDGPWDARKAAALTAYHEWLPIGAAPYDEYRIGELASIFRLETRLVGRDRQVDVDATLAAAPDLRAGIEAVRTAYAGSARSMMGLRQEHWLAQGLRASVAEGVRWQVLAQQVIMGPLLLPRSAPQWLVSPDRRQPAAIADLELGAALGEAGVPPSGDRWDGYASARDRLLGSAQDVGANLVVLSGDSHNGWAYELVSRGRPAGVEFAAHSVSSFGMESRFDAAPERVAADLLARIPELRWCDTSHRGYMVIDITADAVTGEWLFLPSAATRSTELLGRHTLASERDSMKLGSC